MPVQTKIGTLSATIANAASLSDAQQLGAETLCVIYLPAAWTAADLTFQVSPDGSVWSDLWRDGEEYVVDTGGYTAAASSVRRALQVEPGVFCGVEYVKVRSGTAASPVAQEAQRVLTLAERGV